MRGSTVFRWAVTHLPGIVGDVLARSGVGPGDVQAFVPHQANLRIIEAVAQSVGFPAEVAVARDIVDQGNTSAASIPWPSTACARPAPCAGETSRYWSASARA